MISCAGLVGRDGVLQSLDELTRLATTAITDAFPYPQIFVFTNHIVICGATKVYEWVSSALVEKVTVTEGEAWRAIDFHDYIYLSNGKVAVIRDSGDDTYSITTDLPMASALCNYNGQIMAGAPNVEVT
jgi:hypothetical protein